MIQKLEDNPEDSLFKFVEDWSQDWTLQKQKEKKEWWNYNKDKTIKLLCIAPSNKLFENRSWYKNYIRKQMIDMDKMFQQRTWDAIFEKAYTLIFTEYLNEFLSVHFNPQNKNKYKTYLKLRRYVFANIDYNYLFRKIAAELHDNLFNKKLEKQQKQWIFIKTRIAFGCLFGIAFKVILVLVSKNIYLYYLFKQNSSSWCKDCVKVLYYYIFDLLDKILYKEYEKLKSTVLHIKSIKQYYNALEEQVIVSLNRKLINYTIPKLKYYYTNSLCLIFQTLVMLRIELIKCGLVTFNKKRKWKTKRQRFEAKLLKELEQKKQKRLEIKAKKKMWITIKEEVENVTDKDEIMRLRAKYQVRLL